MRKSDPIDVHNQMIELLPTIKMYYDNVELAADVMHLDEVPFLNSMSRHVHNGTARTVDNMNTPILETGLKSVIRSCAVRSFRTMLAMVDIQFKFVRDRNNLRVKVNIVSSG